MGHRDRRQGGDDQVVDQDRPAGDEGDQLVEGVAGEARGAAPLAQHRAPLDVAERSQHEEQAGGEEDQRRQAEAAIGDDAEREVDRETDRGIDGDEETGDAESAVQQRLEAGALLFLGLAQRRLPSQSRAAPMATKRMPSRTPIENGPPPLARVSARIATPRPTKTKERARTEPR